MQIALLLILFMGCGPDSDDLSDPEDPNHQKVVMLVQQTVKLRSPKFRSPALKIPRRKKKLRKSTPTIRISPDDFPALPLLLLADKKAPSEELEFEDSLQQDSPDDSLKVVSSTPELPLSDVVTEIKVFETIQHPNEFELERSSLREGNVEDEIQSEHTESFSIESSNSVKLLDLPPPEVTSEFETWEVTNHLMEFDLKDSAIREAEESIGSNRGSSEMEDINELIEDALLTTESATFEKTSAEDEDLIAAKQLPESSKEFDITEIVSDDFDPAEETPLALRDIDPISFAGEPAILDFITREGAGTDKRLEGSVWSETFCVGLGSASATHFLSLIGESPDLFDPTLVVEIDQFRSRSRQELAAAIEDLRVNIEASNQGGRLVDLSVLEHPEVPSKPAAPFPRLQALRKGFRNLVSRVTPKLTISILVSLCVVWYGLAQAGLLPAAFPTEFPLLTKMFSSIDFNTSGPEFVESVTKAATNNSISPLDVGPAISSLTKGYAMGNGTGGLLPLVYGAGTTLGVSSYVLGQSTSQQTMPFSNRSESLFSFNDISFPLEAPPGTTSLDFTNAHYLSWQPTDLTGDSKSVADVRNDVQNGDLAEVGSDLAVTRIDDSHHSAISKKEQTTAILSEELNSLALHAQDWLRSTGLHGSSVFVPISDNPQIKALFISPTGAHSVTTETSVALFQDSYVLLPQQITRGVDFEATKKSDDLSLAKIYLKTNDFTPEVQTAIGNIGQKWVDSHNGDTLVIRLSESAGIFVSNTEPPVQLQSQQALENMVSRGYTVMTVESLLGISSLEQNPNIVFSSSVDGRSMTGQVVSMDNFGLHNLNEVVDLAEEFNPGKVQTVIVTDDIVVVHTRGLESLDFYQADGKSGWAQFGATYVDSSHGGGKIFVFLTGMDGSSLIRLADDIFSSTNPAMMRGPPFLRESQEKSMVQQTVVPINEGSSEAPDLLSVAQVSDSVDELAQIRKSVELVAAVEVPTEAIVKPPPLSLLPLKEQEAMQQQLHTAGITGDILIEYEDGSTVKCVKGGSVCSKEKEGVVFFVNSLRVPAVRIADLHNLSNLALCPALKLFLKASKSVSEIDPHALFELQLKAREEFEKDPDLKEVTIRFEQGGIAFPQTGNPAIATADQLFGDTLFADDFVEMPPDDPEDPDPTVDDDLPGLTDTVQQSIEWPQVRDRHAAWQRWEGALKGLLAFSGQTAETPKGGYLFSLFVDPFRKALGHPSDIDPWDIVDLRTVANTDEKFEDFKLAAISYLKRRGEPNGLIESGVGEGLLVENGKATLLPRNGVSELLAKSPTVRVHKPKAVLVEMHNAIVATRFYHNPTVETLDAFLPTLVEMGMNHLQKERVEEVVIRLPGDEVGVKVSADRSWKILRKGVNYDQQSGAAESVDLVSFLLQDQKALFPEEISFSLPSKIPWDNELLFWYRPSLELWNDHVSSALTKAVKELGGLEYPASLKRFVIRFPASSVGVAVGRDGSVERLYTEEDIRTALLSGARRITLNQLSKLGTSGGPPDPTPQLPNIVLSEPLPLTTSGLSPTALSELLQKSKTWLALYPTVETVVLKLPHTRKSDLIVIHTDGDYYFLSSHQAGSYKDVPLVELKSEQPAIAPVVTTDYVNVASQFFLDPTVETLDKLFPDLVEMGVAHQNRLGTSSVVIRLPGDEVGVQVFADRSWKLLRKGVNYDEESGVPWVDLSEFLGQTAGIREVQFSLPNRIPWDDDSLFWYRPSLALLNGHVARELAHRVGLLSHMYHDGTPFLIGFPSKRNGVLLSLDGRVERLESQKAVETVLEQPGVPRIFSLMELSRLSIYKGPAEPSPQSPNFVVRGLGSSASDSAMEEMMEQAKPWFESHPTIRRLVVELAADKAFVLRPLGRYYPLSSAAQIELVLELPDTIRATVSEESRPEAIPYVAHSVFPSLLALLNSPEFEIIEKQAGAWFSRHPTEDFFLLKLPSGAQGILFGKSKKGDVLHELLDSVDAVETAIQEHKCPVSTITVRWSSLDQFLKDPSLESFSDTVEREIWLLGGKLMEDHSESKLEVWFPNGDGLLLEIEGELTGIPRGQSLTDGVPQVSLNALARGDAVFGPSVDINSAKWSEATQPWFNDHPGISAVLLRYPGGESALLVHKDGSTQAIDSLEGIRKEIRLNDMPVGNLVDSKIDPPEDLTMIEQLRRITCEGELTPLLRNEIHSLAKSAMTSQNVPSLVVRFGSGEGLLFENNDSQSEFPKLNSDQSPEEGVSETSLEGLLNGEPIPPQTGLHGEVLGTTQSSLERNQKLVTQHEVGLETTDDRTAAENKTVSLEERDALLGMLQQAGISGDVRVEYENGRGVVTNAKSDGSHLLKFNNQLPIPAVKIADLQNLENLAGCGSLKKFLDSNKPASEIEPHALFEVLVKVGAIFRTKPDLGWVVVLFNNEGITIPYVGKPRMSYAYELNIVNSDSQMKVKAAHFTKEIEFEIPPSPLAKSEAPLESLGQTVKGWIHQIGETFSWKTVPHWADSVSTKSVSNLQEDQQMSFYSTAVKFAAVANSKRVHVIQFEDGSGMEVVGETTTTLTAKDIRGDHLFTYQVHPVKDFLQFAKSTLFSLKYPASKSVMISNPDNYADFLKAAVSLVQRFSEPQHLIKGNADTAFLVEKTGKCLLLSTADFEKFKSEQPTVPVHEPEEVFAQMHKAVAAFEFFLSPTVATLDKLLPDIVNMAIAYQARNSIDSVGILLPGREVGIQVAPDGTWKILREGMNLATGVALVDLGEFLTEEQQKFFGNSITFSLPSKIPWDDESLFWYRPSLALLDDHVSKLLASRVLGNASFIAYDKFIIGLPASKQGIVIHRDGRVEKWESEKAMERVSNLLKSKYLTLMDLSRMVEVAGPPEPIPQVPRIVLHQRLPGSHIGVSKKTISDVRTQVQPWFDSHPTVLKLVLVLTGRADGILFRSDGSTENLRGYADVPHVLAWKDTLELTQLEIIAQDAPEPPSFYFISSFSFWDNTYIITNQAKEWFDRHPDQYSLVLVSPTGTEGLLLQNSFNGITSERLESAFAIEEAVEKDKCLRATLIEEPTSLEEFVKNPSLEILSHWLVYLDIWRLGEPVMKAASCGNLAVWFPNGEGLLLHAKSLRMDVLHSQFKLDEGVPGVMLDALVKGTAVIGPTVNRDTLLTQVPAWFEQHPHNEQLLIRLEEGQRAICVTKNGGSAFLQTAEEIKEEIRQHQTPVGFLVSREHHPSPPEKSLIERLSPFPISRFPPALVDELEALAMSTMGREGLSSLSVRFPNGHGITFRNDVPSPKPLRSWYKANPVDKGLTEVTLKDLVEGRVVPNFSVQAVGPTLDFVVGSREILEIYQHTKRWFTRHPNTQRLLLTLPEGKEGLLFQREVGYELLKSARAVQQAITTHQCPVGVLTLEMSPLGEFLKDPESVRTDAVDRAISSLGANLMKTESLLKLAVWFENGQGLLLDITGGFKPLLPRQALEDGVAEVTLSALAKGEAAVVPSLVYPGSVSILPEMMKPWFNDHPQFDSVLFKYPGGSSGELVHKDGRGCTYVARAETVWELTRDGRHPVRTFAHEGTSEALRPVASVNALTHGQSKELRLLVLFEMVKEGKKSFLVKFPSGEGLLYKIEIPTRLPTFEYRPVGAPVDEGVSEETLKSLVAPSRVEAPSYSVQATFSNVAAVIASPEMVEIEQHAARWFAQPRAARQLVLTLPGGAEGLLFQNPGWNRGVGYERLESTEAVEQAITEYNCPVGTLTVELSSFGEFLQHPSLDTRSATVNAAILSLGEKFMTEEKLGKLAVWFSNGECLLLEGGGKMEPFMPGWESNEGLAQVSLNSLVKGLSVIGPSLGNKLRLHEVRDLMEVWFRSHSGVDRVVLLHSDWKGGDLFYKDGRRKYVDAWPEVASHILSDAAVGALV